jgi:hypothetical protein
MHLLRVLPEYSFVRPALYTLFRNLMVFTTSASATAFVDYMRLLDPLYEPFIVALDENESEVVESTIVVSPQGAGASQGPAAFVVAGAEAGNEISAPGASNHRQDRYSKARKGTRAAHSGPSLAQGVFRSRFYDEPPEVRLEKIAQQTNRIRHSLAYLYYGMPVV